MSVHAVLEIQSTESTRQVSFVCESISKPKPESGSNPDKWSSRVLEKPKQTAETNSQIRETKTRVIKPHKDHD